jgi:hypothetical protein
MTSGIISEGGCELRTLRGRAIKAYGFGKHENVVPKRAVGLVHLDHTLRAKTASPLDIRAGVKDDDEIGLEFYSVVQERSASRIFCLTFAASPPRRATGFPESHGCVAIMGQFWSDLPRAGR